jgi:hypothetical protein
LGKPYTTFEKRFESRNEAMIWIINNQFSRRNLNTYDKGVLALRMKPLLASLAKKNNQLALQRHEHIPFEDRVNTRNEIAKMAGTSPANISMIEYLEEHAKADLKQKIRAGDITVNKAYHQICKKSEKPNTFVKVLSFQFPTREITALENLSKKKYRTVSDLLRTAVREYLFNPSSKKSGSLYGNLDKHFGGSKCE